MPPRYANKPLMEVFPKIYERYGKVISISGCGMAGERGYANSGVVFNDLERHVLLAMQAVVAWVQSWEAKE